jgi:dihydropteroate synthase
VAAEFGVALAGPLSLAARAVAAGVEPERVVVEVGSAADGGAYEAAAFSGGLIGVAVAAGWPVLVRLPDGQDEAADLATTTVAAWLGARVFCGPAVRGAGRALRMVAAIRGDVPPAWAVRGLA